MKTKMRTFPSLEPLPSLILEDPLKNAEYRARWRIWHYRAYRLWLERDGKSHHLISCMSCGAIMGLEVVPQPASLRYRMHRWLPHEGQILCLDCYDKGKDFRSADYKSFLKREFSRDWTLDPQGRWRLKHPFRIATRQPVLNSLKKD